MLSFVMLERAVIEVLSSATEDQRVGSEVENGCVGWIFEGENILSGGEL